MLQIDIRATCTDWGFTFCDCAAGLYRCEVARRNLLITGNLGKYVWDKVGTIQCQLCALTEFRDVVFVTVPDIDIRRLLCIMLVLITLKVHKLLSP